MQTVTITTSQNIDIDYEVAGLGERIVARIIDTVLLILLFTAAIVIATMTGSSLRSSSNTFNGFIVAYICIATVAAFYDLVLEIFMNGQSIGKRIMKIRVISLDGGNPTIGQYLIRWLMRIVDFSITMQVGGLICAAVTEKNQRIGDLAAGTTLIKTQPRTTLEHVAFHPPAEDYTPFYPQVTILSDQDVVLIHEVLSNFHKSNNFELLRTMADKIRELLTVSSARQDDYSFLQTVVKDYNHLSARMAYAAR